jgi:hypothetical protein
LLSQSVLECALTSRLSESVKSQEFNSYVAVARSEVEGIHPSTVVGWGSPANSLLGDVGQSGGPSRVTVRQGSEIGLFGFGRGVGVEFPRAPDSLYGMLKI